MKGIPFSLPLIPLVMDSTKTQTRRVIKPVAPSGRENFPPNQFRPDCWYFRDGYYACEENDIGNYVKCPYGVVGSTLYVKESLYCVTDANWRYRADDALVMVDKADESAMLVWAHHKENAFQSSRFMPKWAARTFLRLTEVRVQRLQEITAAECYAEGCKLPVTKDGNLLVDMVKVAPYLETFALTEGKMDPRVLIKAIFASLWDSINGNAHPWRSNPWVWALSFERIEKPEVAA